MGNFWSTVTVEEMQRLAEDGYEFELGDGSVKDYRRTEIDGTSRLTIEEVAKFLARMDEEEQEKFLSTRNENEIQILKSTECKYA